MRTMGPVRISGTGRGFRESVGDCIVVTIVGGPQESDKSTYHISHAFALFPIGTCRS